MKKIAAVLLVLVITLTVAVPVSAGAKGKISDEVQEVMDGARDGDTIPVWLWCNLNIDVRQLSLQEYRETYKTWNNPETKEEMDAYWEIQMRIARDYEQNACQLIIDQLNLTEEELLEASGAMVFAGLTVERIKQAEACACVGYIDLYQEAEVELPTFTEEELNTIEAKFTQAYQTEYNEIAYFSVYNDDTVDQSAWALVSAFTNEVSPSFCYAVLGNRLLRSHDMLEPFALGYCVYEAKTKAFIDIIEAYKTDKREGLDAQLEKYHIGKLIGDMNNDDRMTIEDATVFQKCLAEIEAFLEEDRIWGENLTNVLQYASDFNRDGQRDINDVTAIQMYLADYPAEAYLASASAA